MSKERPILFKGEMVKAILQGNKTQTRRIMKVQPDPGCPDFEAVETQGHIAHVAMEDGDRKSIPCPYGKAGDVLWVRESWRDVNNSGAPAVLYAADLAEKDLMYDESLLDENGAFNYDDLRVKKYDFSVWHTDVGCGEEGCGWKPSIHMPYIFCRLKLKIKRVWVERVQDISEEDAWAEGCIQGDPYDNGLGFFPAELPHPDGGFIGWDTAREWFEDLWNSIYNNWDENPWVWVCEFEIIEGAADDHC